MASSSTQNKPKATVTFVNDSEARIMKKIIRELQSNGVTIHNIKKRRAMVVRCINEHVKRSRVNVDTSSLITNIVNNMAK